MVQLIRVNLLRKMKTVADVNVAQAAEHEVNA